MSGPIIPNQALLNGLNPLAYMGVRPTSPNLFLVETRNPTINDKNFALGTLWMNNNSPYDLFFLANLNQGIATWVPISTSSSGTVDTLTGNTGGPVPALAGNINVIGDVATILAVGNPATNTITLTLAIEPIEKVVSNSGGAVGPDILGDINIVGDNIGITGVGNPGTNTITFSLIGGGPAINVIDGNSGFAEGTTINLVTSLEKTLLFKGNDSATMVLNTTDANGNVSYGLGAFISGAAGSSNNTVLGTLAAGSLTTGTDNVIIGTGAAVAYTGAESNNIIIGALNSQGGYTGENATIRLGEPTRQSRCFIAGIDGVNVGATAQVVTEVSGQLGSAVITGGTGITVTPGANTITISGTGTFIFNYTNVTTTPYVVLTTDDYLSVDTSTLAITIQLPNAPATGRSFIIKDRTGTAATNNITVTTVGGAVTIDGSTSYIMNTNFESINVLFGVSGYEVF